MKRFVNSFLGLGAVLTGLSAVPGQEPRPKEEPPAETKRERSPPREQRREGSPDLPPLPRGRGSVHLRASSAARVRRIFRRFRAKETLKAVVIARQAAGANPEALD